MSSNGCLGAKDVAVCSTAFTGLFTRGLHAVIQFYADQMLQLLMQRRTVPATPLAAQVSRLLPSQPASALGAFKLDERG